MSKDPILTLHKISRCFTQGKMKLHVLKEADLTLHRGEVVALVGPSGSGKSTLLHIAGLLDSPTSGSVTIEGVACQSLNDEKRTDMRRNNVGVVYQAHHLLQEFTALENVIIPQILVNETHEKAKDQALELLCFMGLEERAYHYPSQLSGGEQQRVAIARALINKPSLFLADEPTGNLDPKTSQLVGRLMINSIKAMGLAALIVTHNMALAEHLDRVITIEEGVIAPLK